MPFRGVGAGGDAVIPAPGQVAAGTPEDELEKLAFSNERVQQYTDGKDVVRVIVVADKLVNVVV